MLQFNSLALRWLMNTHLYHKFFPADWLGIRTWSRSIHPLASRCLHVHKGFVHKEPKGYKIKKPIHVGTMIYNVFHMNIAKFWVSHLRISLFNFKLHLWLKYSKPPIQIRLWSDLSLSSLLDPFRTISYWQNYPDTLCPRPDVSPLTTLSY